MHGFVNLYFLLWMTLLVVAPIACVYGLIRTPTPQTAGRTSGVALLGFLLSAWLIFTLAVTVLHPLAVTVLAAPLICAVAVFRPSILVSKGPRIYLICCMAGGELFWIWAAWDQLVRVRQ